VGVAIASEWRKVMETNGKDNGENVDRLLNIQRFLYEELDKVNAELEQAITPKTEKKHKKYLGRKEE
jgi:hypothetical protein